MRQSEQRLRCPYCGERISMLVDPSEAGNPRWVRQHCDAPVLGPLPFLPHRPRRHAALKKLLGPLVSVHMARSGIGSGR